MNFQQAVVYIYQCYENNLAKLYFNYKNAMCNENI